MESLVAVAHWSTINIKLSSTLAFPLVLLWILLLMLLWERRKVRRVIERFVSLASQAAIPTYRSWLPQLSNELARARRTQRALSVVILSFETDGALKSMAHAPAEKKTNGNGRFRIDQIPALALVFPQIGYILRNTARESDIVACGPAANEFVVGLAETNKAQAEGFVHRFNGLTTSTGLTNLRSGIAEFPSDGLTVEDLMSRARANCRLLPQGEAAEVPSITNAESHSPMMTTKEAI